MKKNKSIYSQKKFFRKLGEFLFYLFKDIKYILKYGRAFGEYGVTMYCGRQGYGKTVAMVEYLERMRKKYPNVKIVTNFGYVHQTHAMIDWKDFYEIRNGRDGVIFAIDEIQNEYNSTKWKEFPESLLSEITQQRKQKVKIICSSQVYTRVVKPLREQTFNVVECRTLAERWTFLRSFDALEYEAVHTQPILKNKLKRQWRKNFVQDIKLRELYDTEEKVARMKRTDYIPRSERGING
ncbi:MAG: hypothetical protein ABF649_22920 [Bacillus sp. (in: firmicutes)]